MEDVLVFLELVVELDMVESSVVAVEVGEEHLKGSLEMGVGALHQRLFLTEVLVREVDSFTVHLIMITALFDSQLKLAALKSVSLSKLLLQKLLLH